MPECCLSPSDIPGRLQQHNLWNYYPEQGLTCSFIYCIKCLRRKYIVCASIGGGRIMKKLWFILPLVLLPFLVGLLMDRLVTAGYQLLNGIPIAILFLILSLVFSVCQLKMKKIYSFLLGNSLSITVCILYVWFFHWLEPAARLSGGWVRCLGSFVQVYVLPVINLGARICGVFTNRLDSDAVLLFTNFLLIAAFSVGYICRLRRSS